LLFASLAWAGGSQDESPPQIHWQRSLEDALALSQAQGRPILVALNMDGESASERIVREQYRDPEFVRQTRAFVCVVGSLFRHSARDFDDRGVRIACPRLGEVTCGEHIALEPLLFERFLGGERIAPRHALVGVDGSVRFDLFLLFDLTVIDRRLAAAYASAPAPEPDSGASVDERGLVRARSHRGRLRFEALLRASSDAECARWLDLLAEEANAGSIDGLRSVWMRTPELAARATDVALARGLAETGTATLRSLLQRPQDDWTAVGLGAHAHWIGELSRLDPEGAANRSLIASYVATSGVEGRLAADALGGAETLASAVEAAGGPIDPEAFLETAALLAPPVEPQPEHPLPEAEQLELVLTELENELALRPGDPDLERVRGRAALALAQRRMESGGSGIDFLLSDAEAALATASAARPLDCELLLDRARTAYYTGAFERQEALAMQAWETLPDDAREWSRVLVGGSRDYAALIPIAQQGLFESAWTLECLRWLGDAAARLLSDRSGGDAAAEAAGIARAARALVLAASAPAAEDTDWRTLSGFYAALGRRREEIAFAALGLERFPESDALRTALNVALWSLGREDLAVVAARRSAAGHPESGACAWYLGYALMLQGDWQRRGEEPDSAIATYREAQACFERSAELRPEFAESAEHYRALSALGCGFAQLLADRREAAAQCLVEGVRMRPLVAQVRDGLDREAIDLLDGALEWRASGPSDADPAELLDGLEDADPGNPFWARSIADSELRESLRADGRGDFEAGHRYLERSLVAARRALEVGAGEEDRRALCQSATVYAERLLRSGRLEPGRALLIEAAPLLGLAPPSDNDGEAALTELAATLRGELGPARPLSRPGR
jgi:tetratricopeptide (TPR) repeat protein